VDLGDNLRAKPELQSQFVQAAETLAELNLSRDDRLKLDLEVTWICERAKRQS
jgi:hypothetical protein